MNDVTLPVGADTLADTAGTLTEILRDRAALHPDKTACFHLEDGVTEVAHLTYAQLWETARAHAVGFAQRLEPGSRVMLVFPNSPDFVPLFFGCLLAGMVAVPAAPPRNASGVQRMDTLARAAGCSLGILSPRLARGFERWHEALTAEPGGPEWILADGFTPGDAEAWTDPGATPDTLAVLQFTSGSTGQSKGVMVRHSNILHNCRMLRTEMHPETEIRLVAWLPFFHDWGLFGCLIYPLVYGGLTVYFDPTEFLQRPRSWLEGISKHRATICCAPNFAFDLAADGAEVAGVELDLSCLELAKLGAEPVRWATMEHFASACAPHGFDRSALCPSYGLAESTLIVTGGGRRDRTVRHLHLDRKALEMGRAEPVSADTPGAHDIVSSGVALLDQKVRIADGATGAPKPDYEVGEIWIQGGSVTGGYWQQPDETARAYGAALDGAEGPWLRTGDLGFAEEGELFVCGRLKDLIIKSGSNFFAEDLERSFDAAHPDLRPGCGAAFSIDVGGTERLVLVQEVNYGPRPDPAEVVGAMQKALSREHAVLADAIAVLKPGTLEKTSSGKIRRRATRTLFLADALDPIHLWTSWS